MDIQIQVSSHTKFKFVPGFVLFSQNKFPGLYQDSDWFFQDSKIHTNPYTPEISMLILLTVCYTFHIFHFSLKNFLHFPGPVALFQDFPDLENATVKFQDFPGFPVPVRTLLYLKLDTQVIVCGLHDKLVNREPIMIENFVIDTIKKDKGNLKFQN